MLAVFYSLPTDDRVCIHCLLNNQATSINKITIKHGLAAWLPAYLHAVKGMVAALIPVLGPRVLPLSKHLLRSFKAADYSAYDSI